MPQTNKTLIIVALITAVPSTIAAVGSWQAKGLALETKTEILATKQIVVPLAATVQEVKKQTDGMQIALTAATMKVGKAEGEKTGVPKGVAIEKARAATAKKNQAVGAAVEKAKPFWKR